jgi:hypothetical protein
LNTETGHDLFQARRLFDSGVVELFFPSNIYEGLDYEELRRYRVEVVGNRTSHKN